MKFIQDATSSAREIPAAGLTHKAFEVTPTVKGSNLTLSYSLPQTGLTAISIFNCAGRTEVPAMTKSLSAGGHTQIIGLSGLSRGVHFIRVKQNGMQVTKSFTIAH